MKSMLFRTGSGPSPVQAPPTPGSPRRSLDCFLAKRSIRRSTSESNVMIRSEMRTPSKLGSTKPRMTQMECEWQTTWEELGSPGGGMNKNRNSGGGGNGGYGSDANMGDYYQEMIKSDPTNSLFLTNYAKYLHQVEGDVVKAEEYYERAILASPGDGEVLSLYGNLIWESHRDESRAKSYFSQALQASPNDCMILGSYAHFLWEAEEEEEEMQPQLPLASTLMEVF